MQKTLIIVVTCIAALWAASPVMADSHNTLRDNPIPGNLMCNTDFLGLWYVADPWYQRGKFPDGPPFRISDVPAPPDDTQYYFEFPPMTPKTLDINDGAFKTRLVPVGSEESRHLFRMEPPIPDRFFFPAQVFYMLIEYPQRHVFLVEGGHEKKIWPCGASVTMCRSEDSGRLGLAGDIDRMKGNSDCSTLTLTPYPVLR